jgi:hypothetical protein
MVYAQRDWRSATMTGQQLTNTHPTGRTTGTTQRPGRDHVGQALTFDLEAELARLKGEEHWHLHGRNSATLVKEPNLRLVLIAMQAGTQVDEHHTAGRLGIQVIRGHLRVTVPGQTMDLPAYHLLALDFAVDYDIQALEESAFLLTVAWTGALPEDA